MLQAYYSLSTGMELSISVRKFSKLITFVAQVYNVKYQNFTIYFTGILCKM